MKIKLKKKKKNQSKIGFNLFRFYRSVVSFPPPPLHHYGDSNSGHSAEGEDYEVI